MHADIIKSGVGPEGLKALGCGKQDHVCLTAGREWTAFFKSSEMRRHFRGDSVPADLTEASWDKRHPKTYVGQSREQQPLLESGSCCTLVVRAGGARAQRSAVLRNVRAAVQATAPTVSKCPRASASLRRADKSTVFHPLLFCNKGQRLQIPLQAPSRGSIHGPRTCGSEICSSCQNTRPALVVGRNISVIRLLPGF